jgi:hypothetical protein
MTQNDLHPADTDPIPSDEVVLTAASLLRHGRNQEAIAWLKAREPLTPRALDYLCDAYFQSRDWEKAYETFRLIPPSHAATPANRKLEAKILSNWGRHREALTCIQAYASDHENDLEAMVIAKVCCHNLGDQDNAKRYGQQALHLKDKAAVAPAHVTPVRPNKPGRRVIAYSIWGTQKAYLLGAAINIKLATKHFPGWTVRIYAASSLAPDMLALYRRLGAEVMLADQQFPDVPHYFWRFLVADDPDVQYFLCRDADCRLSAGEAELVGQWMSSKKRFHVARDHVLHDDLMLAGMWGGTGTRDLKMRERIATYFNGKPTSKYGHDQRFLAKMVWPLIRPHVLVHDRYYWTAGVKSHAHKLAFEFGAGYMDEAAVIAEARASGISEQ